MTSSDRPQKRERLRRILERRADAHTIVLTSTAMLSWYLDGARVGVARGADPVIALALTRDSETVFCSSNERERMIEEELPADLEVVPAPWHEPLLGDDLAPNAPGVLHEAELQAELRSARATLLPLELERYRLLCAEAATATTDVLLSAHPELTEQELASRLDSAVVRLGAEATVVLVAGQDRLGYRHPLPTAAKLGSRAMVVVCARRHGMIANLTRWLRFAEPGRSELEAVGRIAEVEADIFDATVPGRPLVDVFAEVAASYSRHGFESGEWLRHHQGGPTGYLGRDPRATPTAPGIVSDGQAFAWNPTAPGAKIEDTVLLDAGTIDVLTVDGRWPTLAVRGRARPDVLQL